MTLVQPCLWSESSPKNRLVPFERICRSSLYPKTVSMELGRHGRRMLLSVGHLALTGLRTHFSKIDLPQRQNVRVQLSLLWCRYLVFFAGICHTRLSPPITFAGFSSQLAEHALSHRLHNVLPENRRYKPHFQKNGQVW